MKTGTHTRRKFDGVIFDLDGTLLDSAPDLHAAANRMLEVLGSKPLGLDKVKSFIGNGIPKLVERCLDANGIVYSQDQRSQALSDFESFYAADLATLTRLYEGVIDMLRHLQMQGISMAICTNKAEQAARDLCRDIGLSHFMETITGGDTIGINKPDPAPLLHTVNTLDLSPNQVLYVGDSETDYLTAKAAGTPFAFFTGGYQSAPIKDFDPDWSFDHMAQLPEIVVLP